jgi:hypothetical protein
MREEGIDHGRAGRLYRCSERFFVVVDHDREERDGGRAGRLVFFVVDHDGAEHRLVLVGVGRHVEQQRRRRHGRLIVVEHPERRFVCVFEQPQRLELVVDQQVSGYRAGARNAPAFSFSVFGASRHAGVRSSSIASVEAAPATTRMIVAGSTGFTK